MKPFYRSLNAYVRLLRLSNAPTAVADVAMGIVIATSLLGTTPASLPLSQIGLLLLASLSLYHGGMVLNDLADVEQDRAERPSRPIPSGEISFSQAKRLSRLLLTIGISCSCWVSWQRDTLWPAAVAFLLAITITAYNSPLKRTAIGPWLMGTCRGLNGLLGLSLAGSWILMAQITPGVIAYVAGLTLFARDETNATKRTTLLPGMFVSLAGLVWLAVAPLWIHQEASPIAKQHMLQQTPLVWWLLWATVFLMIGRYYFFALLKPSARSIQRAVIGAIQGLIILNASLVFGYDGAYYCLAILALLPIAKLLSLWIPAT